jgi:dienelactone hydrolase
VAEVLQEEGIGTLIVDFWPAGSFRSERFDQNAYRKRLVDAFKWLHTLPETRSAKIGCFGSEEGGTAAVAAAAELGTNIRAVVSRGAKLDLPPDVLARVKAPTLLLAGGHDCLFVCHNNDAFVCLKCKKQMRLVAGATHLFEEPGTREKMAAFASNWFVEHLAMQ